ncbi:putative RING-H2 finger protein ATL12 [Vigna radiata var. radiata]|uniref:RING-type E3 ubiquitin transferase n=1 Tax=Vigna radiata var. radiata TaxID=3916 RepID=A0A1S3UDX1_VIGRR|nr:putative RING-H2 finger protein ATL12 [Vigna radiata var. radiata]
MNMPFKNHLLVFIMTVLFFISNVQAQNNDTDSMQDLPQPVHPSKMVVVVALSILFTVSFLLLVYIRFRRSIPLELSNRRSPDSPNFQAQTQSRSRHSGIDKKVIEALPFFMFSSLKGSKQGLECTVCLSQFEDTEILRLLPKCKHAFHMNCIDKWLESHSTCPLCRNNIDPLDIKNFTYSISSRSLRVPSNLTEDTNLEIFVHREPSSHQGSSSSSRFNIGSRFWNLGWSNKKKLLVEQEVCGTNGTHVHKFYHKIVVSDVVRRSRWSDLNSSDMLSLKSEMIHHVSIGRFSPSNEFFCGNPSLSSIFNEDESSFTLLNIAQKRSMSDIAHVPRLIDICKQNRMEPGEASSGNNEREERMRRIWLTIAQRTVQWFAGQERNSTDLEIKHLASDV